MDSLGFRIPRRQNPLAPMIPALKNPPGKQELSALMKPPLLALDPSQQELLITSNQHQQLSPTAATIQFTISIPQTRSRIPHTFAYSNSKQPLATYQRLHSAICGVLQE